MKWLADWLVYVVVRVAVSIVQTMRLETCQQLARPLAYLACDVLRVRRGVVDENLRHVYPELAPHERRVLIRRMWEHLVLMACEIAHAPRCVHETNWREYFHFPIQQKRQFVTYLLEPRPIVLVSGHFGNFEITSYVAGLLGFPTYAIARRLDNPYLDRWVNAFRSVHGQFILPKDGSAGYIDAVLRSGGVIALLGDQHAGLKGCWVDFLGRPASCHKAVALFTLVSGAPLLVSYGKRVGGPLHFEIGLEAVADPRQPGPELANVKTLTQWYNQALERIIRSAPEQYWWVHRRWKNAPPGKHAAAPAVPDDAGNAGGVRRSAA
jgi:Kdo2-lipid IVA lauroyltransferase/acyltransferase